MASTSKQPRRFAPVVSKEVSTASAGSTDPSVLQGIIFDMDGTLCEPQNYMFGQMRAALGITKATDILDHIYSLPQSQKEGEVGEQEIAMEKVRAIEREAMQRQVAQPGLVELMEYLDRVGIKKGICTRNFE